ncbi:putative iSBma2, transposase [Burkholderia pseudomallei MSHR5858]|nr:putative iSBma2, transposase [Burkholderia pseudomallei MSHR5858]
MCGDSGLGDPARMRHARPAKQRDAGSAAFQRSTWVSSCRMAMSAARRAVRLLRFARDGGAMQRRISNVIQLASPIAWCRRTGERHVRRTANEDRGRGGRGARGRRDGTHAGPRMPVLARRRHISVIGYRIRTTANRAQSKTGAEAPQTADEPHVFVSVGFCLSGIRIAGSPRAGSRSCSANRSPDAAACARSANRDPLAPFSASAPAASQSS